MILWNFVCEKRWKTFVCKFLGIAHLMLNSKLLDSCYYGMQVKRKLSRTDVLSSQKQYWEHESNRFHVSTFPSTYATVNHLCKQSACGTLIDCCLKTSWFSEVINSEQTTWCCCGFINSQMIVSLVLTLVSATKVVCTFICKHRSCSIYSKISIYSFICSHEKQFTSWYPLWYWMFHDAWLLLELFAKYS
jgi:hypothetical protein